MKSNKYLICDTNVWYNIASGRQSVSPLTAKGGRPCVAFSTLCEIVGGIKSSNFEQRKAACQAILDVNAVELPDSETFVAQDNSWPSWSQHLPSVVRSDRFDEHSDQLMAGNEVCSENIVPLLRGYRTSFETQRRLDVGDAVATMATQLGYDGTAYQLAVRDNSPMPQGWAIPRADLERANPLSEFMQVFRSWIPSRFNAAIDVRQLDCYAAIYREYLFGLVSTPKKPDKNDLWDLELLMYSVDDQHVVVSQESKGFWTNLARGVGWSHRVVA